MYFSAKKHILSNTILFVGFIRLMAAGVSGAGRLLLRRGGLMPDMADRAIWALQMGAQTVSIALAAIIFIVALRRVGKYLSVVDEGDWRDMAKLQEEVFGDKKAALSGEMVRKLLRIWFAILVGAQIMYDVSAEIYRRFAVGLADILAGDSASAYTALYNLTHGFKYQGMVIALLLGVMMTGIFLGDELLKFVSIATAAVYMFASAGVEMYTLQVMGKSFGIVISSVIFHLQETVGLFVLAVYLRVAYRGV